MAKIKPNGSKERMDERLERMHKIECRNFNINGVSKIDGSYIPEIGCADGKVKPKTNADRIRAMTDEELAEFCSKLGCYPSASKETCIGVSQCTTCWLDWLKEEGE